MKVNYFMLALVYLSGLAAPVNQFKVPPMMHKIMQQMDISLAYSGWLMSAFALAGFFFALPSGYFLKRVGVKNLSICALVVMLCGSVIGTYGETVSVILFSRVLEGVGMSLISVSAPAALSAWFPPGKRGMPMGVWATWVPAGNILIFTVAPFICMETGWRYVWWFSSAYTALMLILFVIFFRMPEDFQQPVSERKSFSERLFFYKEAWHLAGIFILFNILTISVKSYMPVFLETVRGLSCGKASGIITVMMFFSVSTAPLAGLISDILRSRKGLILYSCVIAFVSVIMMFHITVDFIFLPLALLGIAGGMMPVGIFTAVTELFREPEKAGGCMAAVVFGQYLGMFIGPVLFSSIADGIGWLTASYFLASIAVIAFLSSMRLKME